MGGGPPASRPRRELRSARRLEARPGPATAHGHRSQAHQSLRCPPHQWGRVADVWLCASSRSPARPLRRPPAPRPALAALIAEPTPNFARNSPTTASSFEFRPLELQRFQTSLKLHSIELRATFLEARPRHHPRAPQPGPPSLRHPPQLWGLLCSRVALTPLPPTGTAAWPIGVAAKPHPNPTSLTSSLHTQFRT